MHDLLSTRILIARMTPTALAETIASLEQGTNLDCYYRDTINYMRRTLAHNVGLVEAAKLIDAAR